MVSRSAQIPWRTNNWQRGVLCGYRRIVKRWIIAAASAFVVGALLSGCGRSGDSAVSTASGTEISSIGISVFAPADRPTLPTVSGATVDGGYLDLATFRGRVVVLNAWASWCVPCKEELPVFVGLASSFQEVAFVGLDVKDQPDEARAMISTYQIPYPSIVDRGASILLTIPTVPPEAVPSTVIIDKQGRVAARVIGAVKPGMLEPVLTALLGE